MADGERSPREDALRVQIALLAIVVMLTTGMPAQQRALQVGIGAAEYQSRRARLSKTLGSDAVLIAFSHEQVRRTGDVNWPFRQEDNLERAGCLRAEGRRPGERGVPQAPGSAAGIHTGCAQPL